MNEDYFELKDLYTAFTARGNTSEVKRLDTIVCRSLNHGNQYQDIITGNIYNNNRFDASDNGKVVVFFAEPLFTRLNSDNLKDAIMKKGYITRNDAIEIYKRLNNIKTYDETIPENTILLSKKTYLQEPALYRTEELEKLMISLALNKKIILITGPSNIGKTSLVDELAYLQQQKKAPEFLQTKEIIEINIAALNKPKLELKEIINYAKNNKAILFVDGVTDITSNNQSYIDMLMYEVERNGLKLIISTSSNTISLGNRFDVIEIKELTEEQIKDIAKREFMYQSTTRNISLQQIENNLDEITTILLGCTTYTDDETLNSYKKDHNPGFILSIIDRSFANAQVKNKKELEYQDIINSIQKDTRINKDKKTKANEIISSLIPTEEKPKSKFKFTLKEKKQ